MITRRQFQGGVLAGLTAALLPRLAARAAGEPYKIGSIFSYTGPAAFLGDRMKRSVELYVEEANKKGGIQGRLAHGGRMCATVQYPKVERQQGND